VSDASSQVNTATEPAEQVIDVTLVVPVGHASAQVEELIAAWGERLDDLGLSWEAILVYDGVRGPAWEAGLALQASSDNRVRTIGLHRVFGESVCLSSAFEHAGGRWIMTAPDYLQVDVRALDGLVEALRSGADLATCRRTGRLDPMLAKLQSWVFNSILRTATGAPFHDLTCCVRLMRREVVEELTIYGNMYRYLPVLAFRQGFRVEELPAKHIDASTSRVVFGIAAYVRRALDILGVVFLTRFTHKPLRFFGGLGGASLVLGSTLGLGLGLRRLLYPHSPLFSSPLFLLGVLLLVLGAQIIGFGLVGEIIIFTQAKNVREYRIESMDE
jgi:hypothetical protein